MRILKQTDSKKIRLLVLNIIPYVTEKEVHRNKLIEQDGFSTLVNIFVEAIQNNDKETLYAIIPGISHYSNDAQARMLFINTNKPYNTYKVLGQCLDTGSGAPSATRLAAAGIITRLMKKTVLGCMCSEILTLLFIRMLRGSKKICCQRVSSRI